MTARIPQDVRENQLKALRGLKFVKWVGEYTGSHSKAEMQCEAGHMWSASIAKLLLQGTGCPECMKATLSAKFRSDPQDVENRLSLLPGMAFHGWRDGEFINMRSYAHMTCGHGHEWYASAGSLLLGGKGCDRCAQVTRAAKQAADPSDVARQINASGAVKFLRWEDGAYRSNHSRAVVECTGCGREWDAYVNNLQKGRGCAACAKNGFNPGKPGVLYALRSECGQFLKVGITNSYRTRMPRLKKVTPFRFSVVARLDGHGDKVREYERMLHKAFQSAGMCGFDGSTEWMVFDQGILDIMHALA